MEMWEVSTTVQGEIKALFQFFTGETFCSQNNKKKPVHFSYPLLFFPFKTTHVVVSSLAA